MGLGDDMRFHIFCLFLFTSLLSFFFSNSISQLTWSLLHHYLIIYKLFHDCIMTFYQEQNYLTIYNEIISTTLQFLTKLSWLNLNPIMQWKWAKIGKEQWMHILQYNMRLRSTLTFEWQHFGCYAWKLDRSFDAFTYVDRQIDLRWL